MFYFSCMQKHQVSIELLNGKKKVTFIFLLLNIYSKILYKHVFSLLLKTSSDIMKQVVALKETPPTFKRNYLLV